MTQRPPPKIVMTLLLRDEADIVTDNLWYHALQGVQSFIIMDNKSTDRSAALIAEAARFLDIEYLFQEQDDYHQTAWVTQMARRAATHFGADWVINNDADEFWFSPDGRLVDLLAGVAPDVGAIEVARVNAVLLRPDTPDMLAETHPRHAFLFDLDSRNSADRPLPPKMMHRGCAEVVVAQGNHSVQHVPGRVETDLPLRIYHYPHRNLARYERKIMAGGAAYARNSVLPKGVGRTWRQHYEQMQKEGLRSYWEAQSWSPQEAAQAQAQGRLQRDTHIQEALRESDQFRQAMMAAQS